MCAAGPFFARHRGCVFSMTREFAIEFGQVGVTIRGEEKVARSEEHTSELQSH